MGGGGVGKDRSPWLSAALFMWGNVWYVWYLGVYFPGCSWVPGVEMWLLHTGGPWWAWLAVRGSRLDLEAAGLLLQVCSLTAQHAQNPPPCSSLSQVSFLCRILPRGRPVCRCCNSTASALPGKAGREAGIMELFLCSWLWAGTQSPSLPCVAGLSTFLYQ